MRWRYGWLVWTGVILLAGACRPTQTAQPTDSIWGPVLTFAQTEQSNAPSLYADDTRVTLAWVGADESGVHHDIRAIENGRMSPIVVLPLPPAAPRDSQLRRAGGGSLHLLWTDLDANQRPQVYNAVINDNLEVFRGPLTVSTNGSRCYDSLSTPEGGVWAVWNDGDSTSPALYSAYIEPTGLALRSGRVASAGGCPVIASTLDGDYVLWSADDALWGGELINGRLFGVRRLTDAPPMNDAATLPQLQAGSDGERLYALWNIQRTNGTRETWIASGTPDDDSQWEAPSRLQVTVDDTTTFDTTLNTGRTLSASTAPDGLPVTNATPLDGVTTVLPIAAYIDGTLSLIYLDEGEVVGFQQVITTEPLLGPPTLTIDRNRHLYLAWAEPGAIGPAAVRATATRRLTE